MGISINLQVHDEKLSSTPRAYDTEKPYRLASVALLISLIISTAIGLTAGVMTRKFGNGFAAGTGCLAILSAIPELLSLCVKTRENAEEGQVELED